VVHEACYSLKALEEKADGMRNLHTILNQHNVFMGQCEEVSPIRVA